MLIEKRRIRTHAVFYGVFGIALAMLISACGGPQNVAEERAEQARLAEGDIVIGAAWPWSSRNDGLYWEGMQMAVDEINADGGVLGRSLRIRKEDDRESVNEGRLSAQRFADDLEVVAVIGHLNSHVSIPAASIYENAGLLMLNPASTSPELTQKGFTRVFRSVNSDVRVSQEMVDFAETRGYKQVLICYVRNEYGMGLANAFDRQAGEAGIQVIDRQSYDPLAANRTYSFQRILDAWKDLDFDAIFLAGMPPQAGYFVAQARASGIGVPIFGGDALDSMEFVESAGEAAEGVVVASIFHPDNPRTEVQHFNDAFAERYGTRPDSWAARGYEAVRLLAHAMTQAGSTVPDEVAVALRRLDGWAGITGTFAFDDKGDVIGKAMVKAVVHDGGFAFLEDGTTLAREQAGTPVQPVADRP